jgi:hypothetical protein
MASAALLHAAHSPVPRLVETRIFEVDEVSCHSGDPSFSAMASRNDVELAAPGQRLGSAVDLLPGEGAYVYGEHVFASAVGQVERTASGQGVQVCTSRREPSTLSCTLQYRRMPRIFTALFAHVVLHLSGYCPRGVAARCECLAMY